MASFSTRHLQLGIAKRDLGFCNIALKWEAKGQDMERR